MLRRAPTSISLSNRDVAEHLEHIELQKRRDRENAQYRRHLERISYSKTSGFRPPALGGCRGENWKRQATFPEHEPYRGDTGFSFYAVDSLNEEYQDEIRRNARTDQDSPRRRSNQMATVEPVLDPCSGSEDEEGFIPINLIASTNSYEEGTVLIQQEYDRQPQRSSQPRFDHGFVETTSNELSSFDVSTPVTGQVRSVQRLRSRIPLPRSPLFHSHGANSPERRATSSLTPCIPSYDTPGLLLSQPARRPKSYRPRSESYSYEESERASAGYDDIQGSDNDSSSSRAPGEERISSREEIYGRPSQESALDGDLSSSPLPFIDDRRTHPGTSQPEQVTAENRVFYFSSPRLHLPPPFSAVPRDLSMAAPAPSVSGEGPHLRSPSTSPPRSGVRGLRASPADQSGGSADVERAGSASSSILQNLTSLPIRLLEAYRSRSPLQSHSDTSGSEFASSARRMTVRVHSPDLVPASTASDQFRIYDDRRPASMQPQTPQHLPESRHQSQFHPSYTAPAGPGMGSIRRSGWELRRRRRTRSDSPAGMETPGFRGLYGGQENVDDEVTFSRAARRLMFLESARRGGRSMSSTPGRELPFEDD